MTQPAFPPSYAKRILSLDVLRGLTIAVMILVNNNGGAGSWSFLNHAEWNGFTLADLVFPCFLFVVGASIVCAVEARIVRGATRLQLLRHTLLRACSLFLLGVLLNGYLYVSLAHLRIYGVLQRIALCYLAAGLLYLFDRRLWTKLALCVLLLLGYWALLRWTPVPGSGQPGRNVAFMHPRHNIVAWVDRKLLAGHLYLPQEPPTHDERDPEGLLSTLPALSSTLLGMIAAFWLRERRFVVKQRTLGLGLSAAIFLVLGYFWSFWFPLNKNLWTSSYVLVAAGWSLVLLAAVHWAAEQRGWLAGWTWPWRVFGANSIFAFLFSEVLAGALNRYRIQVGGRWMDLTEALQTRLFAYAGRPGWSAFCFSLAFLAVCFLPVWLLWRRRLFLKI